MEFCNEPWPSTKKNINNLLKLKENKPFNKIIQHQSLNDRY